MRISTDSQIQKIIKQATKDSKESRYAVLGCRGLFLRIRPRENAVTADFCHRYTHPYTEKRPTISLGRYPSLSLADAKQAYVENRTLLAQDIDPIEHREQAKQNEISKRKQTLRHFIREWVQIENAKNLTAKTQTEKMRYIARIDSALGGYPVAAITPAVVIDFVNEQQGKHGNAAGITAKGILKSILQIAVRRRAITQNPASDLVGTYKAHKPKHRPAITDPCQFAQLLRDIDAMPDTHDHRREVLQLLALVFVRPLDACAMQWADIDRQAQIWSFRPAKAGSRDDMGEIVVPLSRQALAIIDKMHPITGKTEFVFFTHRKTKPHTDRQQLNKALQSDEMNAGAGYKDIHSPHGFRASAKTMLMERLGYDELITELQLGHRMLNRYGRAYGRMDMLDDRREMMQAWASYLDELKDGVTDNLIFLHPKNREKYAVNQ